jgi:hypothetical protein
LAKQLNWRVFDKNQLCFKQNTIRLTNNINIKKSYVKREY